MMRSFLIPILDDLVALPGISVGNVVDDIQMQATGASAAAQQGIPPSKECLAGCRAVAEREEGQA
eukprot:8931602-Pyramimonas_sp.AAC.1